MSRLPFNKLPLLSLALLLAACSAPTVAEISAFLQAPVHIAEKSDLDHATPTMEPMAGMGAMAQDPLTIGDPAKGKELFKNGNGNADVPACFSCHNDVVDEVKVGPSLADIATHAVMHAQEQNQDVPSFLRSSIVEPNADLMEEPGHIYSVNGVSLMYQNYGKDLTEDQIEDLVAYLMTLK